MADEKGISPILAVRDMALKQRVIRLATLERRGNSQMTRLLLEDRLNELEQARDLPPIEEDAAFQAAS